jgi:dolichol-phosphate mannosyltransferase
MTAALVTTFNEADTIGPLVRALKKLVDRVMVVDDPATKDNTEAIAAASGAETILDCQAYGIGPCLMAGFRQLVGNRVVVIDAGGSHDPWAIPFMLKYRADVVIGSRFIPGARYAGSPHRKRASKAYAKACNHLTRKEIADWTSGYRVYSPRAVSTILLAKPSARMHAWQVQSLVACVNGNCTVAEYPITYRGGRSSMNASVAWEAVKTLGELR